MSPARDDGLAVAERRSSVICPGQLEDAGRSLDALDPWTRPKPCASVQILDELSHGKQESRLLLARQAIKISTESGEPCVGRQGRLRSAPLPALGPVTKGAEELLAGREGVDTAGGEVCVGLALAGLPLR